MTKQISPRPPAELHAPNTFKRDTILHMFAHQTCGKDKKTERICDSTEKSGALKNVLQAGILRHLCFFARHFTLLSDKMQRLQTQIFLLARDCAALRMRPPSRLTLYSRSA